MAGSVMVARDGPNADVSVALGTAQMRLRAASQLFKRALLGEQHLGGGLQHGAVLTAILADGVDEREWISERTWSNWVNGSGKGLAQYHSLARLDSVAQRTITWRRPSDGAALRWPDGFFVDLVRGGLLRAIFGAERHSEAGDAGLHVRANKYVPTSAWHLHVDAIEVSALDFGDDRYTWSVAKRAGALHVLGILDALWAPRHRLIYGSLSSDGRLRQQHARRVEHRPRRADPGAWRELAHVASLKRQAGPRCRFVPCELDAVPQHALISMLGILGDTAYLREDRLAAWSLDLASATIATGALLWTDRARLVVPSDRTARAWLAMQEVFFGETAWKRVDPRVLDAAIDACGVVPTAARHRRLRQARDSYRGELASLGFPVSAVAAIKDRCERTHPHRLTG